VTDLQTVSLATMAVVLVVMAGIQIGLMVIAIRVGRQVTATTDEIRREVRPLVEKAHRISNDAARAAALTVAQVERIDRLLASTSARVDETLGLIQNAVVEPVRQGAAVMTALRAAFAAFRSWRGEAHVHHAREDEDALFVG
jgi:hypothetical protein